MLWIWKALGRKPPGQRRDCETPKRQLGGAKTQNHTAGSVSFSI